MNKRRLIIGAMSIIYVILIFFFTFQNKTDTEALSDGLNNMIKNVGINMYSHELRNLIHIPMYFVLGCILAFFMGYCKNWVYYTAVVGCIVGLTDESVKIFLPTREFDFEDLLRDFLGILLSILVFLFIKKRKDKSHKESN